MKLRVVELLIITTLPAMVLAEKGLPSFGLVAATLIGGTLAAGASNAFNMVIEADTDKLMARTSKRPLVLGTVSKVRATIFASVIGILSLSIFEIFTTPLATLLTALAIFYYVVIYTIILKPNTAQNIVWGGAAGCMPVLIGWAAVTGTLTWVPVAFFMVVFFWTPPHFWALALRIGSDYAAAGVPMLPVTAGPAETARQIWLYTILLVAMSLMLWAVAGMGLVYLAVAVIGGGIFLLRAWRLRSDVLGDGLLRGATRLYRFSISYLTLIFAAIAIDSILPR